MCDARGTAVSRLDAMGYTVLLENAFRNRSPAGTWRSENNSCAKYTLTYTGLCNLASENDGESTTVAWQATVKDSHLDTRNVEPN